MQINSSSSVTPQSASRVDNSAQVNDLRDRLAVQQEQKKSQGEKQEKVSQERFDVDEQAIALVEQQLSASQSTNENNPQGQSSTGYDEPSQSNQTAVSAYQSVGDIAERENIQQAFGVDLYA